MTQRRNILSHLLLAMSCATAVVSALSGSVACGKQQDIHETDEGKNQPCVSCHRAAYVAAINPKHVGTMPETCKDCHSTKAWVPATASDHRWFPLQNKHASTPCASCHTKGYAKGDTPESCVGCHQKDYDRATNPPHAGYSTECQTCHGDAGWRPASFDHPWPLEGKHATTSCFACHTGTPPVYRGTPRNCIDCHSDDFARASANVTGHGGFSKNCEDCHARSAWTPALNGAHPESKFPIATGTHSAGAGISCTSCHDPTRGTSAGGQNTDCIHCHLGKHTRPGIDSKHSDVNGYVGKDDPPNFCRQCHPDGRN